MRRLRTANQGGVQGPSEPIVGPRDIQHDLSSDPDRPFLGRTITEFSFTYKSDTEELGFNLGDTLHMTHGDRSYTGPITAILQRHDPLYFDITCEVKDVTIKDLQSRRGDNTVIPEQNIGSTNISTRTEREFVIDPDPD